MYDISAEEVVQGFTTEAGPTEVQLLINHVSSADACLEANSVPEASGRLMKLYAIRHLLTLGSNSGAGTVTQQSSASGASRSMSGWQQGTGLESTSFGSMLAQLDASGCVTRVVLGSPPVAMLSVGSSRGGRL